MSLVKSNAFWRKGEWKNGRMGDWAKEYLSRLGSFTTQVGHQRGAGFTVTRR